MLDLKKLKYLDAIYRHGSFTQASKELFVSQPAISAAITSLENQLGVNLLIRNSKSISFTPAGERFMIYAQHIIQECEKAEQDMKFMSNSFDQTLRMGLSPSLSHHLLPYLYEAFFPTRPQASLQIYENTMSHHINMLQEGTLDLTYNALPEHPIDGIEIKRVTSAQVYAIMPSNHRLASYPELHLDMLNGESVSLPDKNSRIYPLMMNEFKKRGVVPGNLSYHDQIICMFDMVKCANYICFVNEGAYVTLCDTDPALEARPLADPITFDVGFIKRSDTPLPKIGQDLIEFSINTSKYWLNNDVI